MKLLLNIVSVFITLHGISAVHGQESNITEDYRLPTNVFPTHYLVGITAYLPGYGWKEDERSKTFDGAVVIDLEIREATDRIVLHADSLKINYTEIKTSAGDIHISRFELKSELQFLVLYLNKELQPGTKDVQVVIKFDGQLRTDKRGFYLTRSPNPENGKLDKLNAVTQFETTAARFMIPCFDEPSFKATWQLSLIYPTGATALSNTVEQVEGESGEWKVVLFKKTVKMSSYLLAIFIGDVEYKETLTDRGTRIRVYAPPAYIDTVDHSLNVSRITVEGFEKHFNIDYPMEKIDFVAVLDFGAGAMENWGLIVHRNSLLLGNGDGVTGTVIHELAHQWFGNLVTMDFWQNAFLNEAFASYMTAEGLSYLDPDLDSDFYNTQHGQNSGLDDDSTNAIRDLVRSGEGIALTNALYAKGSSLIRMIEKIIGKESFDNAIRWYLFEHQYGNTNEKDLYEAFEKFMPKDLLGPDGERFDMAEFAECWTDQNGYPTIHVEKTLWNTIRLTQQLDTLVSVNRSVCGYRWDVPLWYQQSGRDEVEFMWFGRDQYSLELNVTTPVVFNANSNGFYRVSYTDELLSEIVDTLKTGQVFSDSTKFRLLSDAAVFAKQQRNTWHLLVKLSSALSEDRNKVIKSNAAINVISSGKHISNEARNNSADLQFIDDFLSSQTLIGDCNPTTTYKECTNLQPTSELICALEALHSGYSTNRLLEYLKTETDPESRIQVIGSIKCSDREALKKVLNNEEYNLSDEEKLFVNYYLGNVGGGARNFVGNSIQSYNKYFY